MEMSKRVSLKFERRKEKSHHQKNRIHTNKLNNNERTNETENSPICLINKKFQKQKLLGIQPAIDNRQNTIERVPFLCVVYPIYCFPIQKL